MMSPEKIVQQQEMDDLTKVKGIAQKRQAWLQEKLNVTRFADLAALSVDQIESQLRKDGQPASQRAIASWIEQAQTLAAEAQRPNSTTKTRKEPVANPESESLAAWRPVASFIVEFQERVADGRKQQRTQVHYVETDKSFQWPGVALAQLGEWMEAQSGVQTGTGVETDTAVPPDVQQEPTEPRPAPVPVTIQQLRLFQPPDASTPAAIGKPGRPFMGVVKSQAPCAAEIQFRTEGSREAAFTVRLHARHLGAGGDSQSQTRFQREVESSNAHHYRAVLPAVTFAPGLYRFGVIVQETAPQRQLNYLEFPVVQVV